MKGFTVLFIAACIAMATAELPRFRNGKLRSRVLSRQEAAPGNDAEATTPVPEAEAPYPPAQGGPYPPSGWRPSGQAFILPARQEANPPTQDYGTPTQTYGAPSLPPAEAEVIPGVEPEVETVNFDSQQTSKFRKVERLTKSQKLRQPAKQENQQTVLYLLPEAQFQNLVVANAAAPQGLQYFGKLQAQTPIVASGFVYTPQYVQVY